MKDKKFPTEDVCRVFNILVRISAYYENEDGKTNERNLKFMQELIGRLRHSIYDIPKPLFTSTLSNCIESCQPLVASKFVNIIKQI